MGSSDSAMVPNAEAQNHGDRICEPPPPHEIEVSKSDQQSKNTSNRRRMKKWQDIANNKRQAPADMGKANPARKSYRDHFLDGLQVNISFVIERLRAGLVADGWSDEQIKELESKPLEEDDSNREEPDEKGRIERATNKNRGLSKYDLDLAPELLDGFDNGTICTWNHSHCDCLRKLREKKAAKRREQGTAKCTEHDNVDSHVRTSPAHILASCGASSAMSHYMDLDYLENQMFRLEKEMSKDVYLRTKYERPNCEINMNELAAKYRTFWNIYLERLLKGDLKSQSNASYTELSAEMLQDKLDQRSNDIILLSEFLKTKPTPPQQVADCELRLQRLERDRNEIRQASMNTPPKLFTSDDLSPGAHNGEKGKQKKKKKKRGGR